MQGRTHPTCRGPNTSAPLINNPANALSFNPLVQLHVLRALRPSHAIGLTKVRSAISYAQEQLHVQRRINAGKDTRPIAQDDGLDLVAITKAIRYELKIAA